MEEKPNNTFFTLIKIGLLIYTGLRTVDLVWSTLPDGLKLFGICALAGVDLALLMWDNWTLHHARGATQHSIGLLMIIVNLIGIGAAVVGDAARIVDPIGSKSLINALSIWVIPAIVLSNVAGIIAAGQADPRRKTDEKNREHNARLASMRHELQIEEDEAELLIEIENKRNTISLERARNRDRLGRTTDRYWRQVTPPALSAAPDRPGIRMDELNTVADLSGIVRSGRADRGATDEEKMVEIIRPPKRHSAAAGIGGGSSEPSIADKWIRALYYNQPEGETLLEAALEEAEVTQPNKRSAAHKAAIAWRDDPGMEKDKTAELFNAAVARQGIATNSIPKAMLHRQTGSTQAPKAKG